MQKKLSGIILFAVLIILMVWAVFGAVQSIFGSEHEKDASYAVNGWEAADAYYDSNLIGSDNALKLRTRVNLISGNKKTGSVYIHKERLLREPKELDSSLLAETAEHINSFYRTYSLPTCMTIFTAASEIYTECLPEHTTVPSQLPELEEFRELTDSKIRYVDAHHLLSTFKDDYIYYRTDSGCTAYGAYCIYRSIIRKMGYYPISYDSCFISHVKNDFRGDLYRDCLYDKVVPDILDVYTYENSRNIISMTSFDGNEYSTASFYNEALLDSDNAEEFYAGKPALLTEIETDNESSKNLLVIKDTEGDAMLPFLVQHYTKVSVIDINCLDRAVTELVNPKEYQQVLIMCSGDTLENTKAFSYLGSGKEEKASD